MRLPCAYIDAVIKATEVYNPNLDVTQGGRLRELIKLMRDHIEQQGDLSQYQTKLSFDAMPTANSQNPVTSAGIKAYSDEMETSVKGGVQPEGDTLKKLYDLIISSLAEVTVETIAERDAYNVGYLPSHVFVRDDGDGKWALYKALTTGVNAEYVKLSDPDTFNSIMNASQIKAVYESNPDTNAFTDLLLQKLTNIDTTVLLNRANHTGTQTAATISDLNNAVYDCVISGTLQVAANYIAGEIALGGGGTYVQNIKLSEMVAEANFIYKFSSYNASPGCWVVRGSDGNIKGTINSPQADSLVRKDYVDNSKANKPKIIRNITPLNSNCIRWPHSLIGVTINTPVIVTPIKNLYTQGFYVVCDSVYINVYTNTTQDTSGATTFDFSYVI